MIIVNNKISSYKGLNKSDKEQKHLKKELLKTDLHHDRLFYQNPQLNFVSKVTQITIGY